MDVLSDVFETIEIRGALYFRTHFSPPWAITVPTYRKASRFHLVVQGICHVRLPSGESLELRAGDLLLIPNGQGHILSDSPSEEAPDLETVLSRVGYDGRGVLSINSADPDASTQLVCGHFSFAEYAEHPLLRALPNTIHITPSIRSRNAWLDDALRSLVGNVFSNASGSRAAVVRLSEIVFIEVLRVAGEQSPDLGRVLASFADPHIGKALDCMHRDIAAPWNVETLAREAGMSRSRFAERFQAMLGMGPAAYLTEWRLQHAVRHLTNSSQSIGEIARRCGYQSPAAFTRAFTIKFGASPKEMRRGRNRSVS